MEGTWGGEGREGVGDGRKENSIGNNNTRDQKKKKNQLQMRLVHHSD